MKINIHTDQYLPPVDQKPLRSAGGPVPSATQGPSVVSDELAASSAGANIQSALNNVESARATRVAALATLYAGGRYVVNSAMVAQRLVSGVLSR